MGFEGGVDTLPADFRDRVRSGTDVVILRRSDVRGLRRLASHDAAQAILTFDGRHPFAAGQVLMIADSVCSQATLFQATGTATQTIDGTITSTLQHAVTLGTQPGNCVKALRGQFDCANTTGAITATFLEGAMVMPFSASAYYVTADDPPTLARRFLTQASGNAELQEEVLLDEVEDMQILYGIDSLDDGQYVVDSYVQANAVTDWEQVLSMRVALLLRTEPFGSAVGDEPATITVLDKSVSPPDDNRLRRVFSSVITLRNRLP
jgi:type IV pilus assembly protein PilW